MNCTRSAITDDCAGLGSKSLQIQVSGYTIHEGPVSLFLTGPSAPATPKATLTAAPRLVDGGNLYVGIVGRSGHNH